MTMRQRIIISVLACVMLFAWNQAQAFYNPSAGRWLSRDPIGESGGRNLFGFPGNDAVNVVDSSGLQAVAPSIDCWPTSSLDKIPGQGVGKTLTCKAKLTGCLACCDEKFPICGGSQKKWAACVALCKNKETECNVGIGSTKPDLGPKAPKFPDPPPWWHNIWDWIKKKIW
jgi:hypothetical protein